MYGKTGFKTKKEYNQARYQRKKAEREANKPPDPILLLTDIELAYIAGLVDGEGSIHATRKQTKGTYYPFLCVTMTSPDVIKWLASKVGNKAIYTAPPERYKLARKATYSFRLQGKRAKLLCGRLLPYLKVKHLHTQVLLRWPCDARTGAGITIDKTGVVPIREQLAAELRKLNGYRYNKRLGLPLV